MFMLTVKFDKKKAVFIVIMAALVLIGIVLLAGTHSRGDSQAAQKAVTNVKSEKNRVAYLQQLGWEVETPALSEEKVVIPRTFSEVFETYNQLQLRQGFDLSHYCGTEVDLFTYRVTNAPEEGEVLAQLYVYNGQVIGGDVHSTALDGFMQGLK